jgi:hypothetical protein
VANDREVDSDRSHSDCELEETPPKGERLALSACSHAGSFDPERDDCDKTNSAAAETFGVRVISRQ